jgi:hypothetical protein
MGKSKRGADISENLKQGAVLAQKKKNLPFEFHHSNLYRHDIESNPGFPI